MNTALPEDLQNASHIEFKLVIWLPNNKRVGKCINIVTLKFLKNNCLYYLHEIYGFIPSCRLDKK